MARQPDDEPCAFEPAQIIGGLAAAIGRPIWVVTARTRVGLSNPASRWVNPMTAASTAITGASPNGSPGAYCTVNGGRSSHLGEGFHIRRVRASADCASHRRWLAF